MAALTAENQKLRDENRDLALELEAAADELAKYKSLFFRRASEKLSVEERQQMRLFDEAEQTADENSVACPVNWNKGDPVIVPPPKTAQEVVDRKAMADVERLDFYLVKKKL